MQAKSTVQKPINAQTESTEEVSRRGFLRVSAVGVAGIFAGCNSRVTVGAARGRIDDFEVTPKYICGGDSVTVDYEAFGDRVWLEVDRSGGANESIDLFEVSPPEERVDTARVDNIQSDTEIRIMAQVRDSTPRSRSEEVFVVPRSGRTFTFLAEGECLATPNGDRIVYRFSSDLVEWGPDVVVTRVTVENPGRGTTIGHGSTSIGVTDSGTTTGFQGDFPGGDWLITDAAGLGQCSIQDSVGSGGPEAGGGSGGGGGGDLGRKIINITVACP